MKTEKRLKIAIFHLAFVYSGGGERLVLEQAIYLAKQGYEVTCFAPVIDRERCFPELMKQVTVKKILPRILPSWFPDIELFSILAACVFVPFFFYKFRAYDIYFGANQPGAWIGYWLSKINKKPYVIYLAQPTRLVHLRLIDQQVGLRITDGVTFLHVFRIIFRPLIQFFDVVSIRGAGVVFANGSYAKGILEQVYGIRAVNCPAGTDLQRSKSRLPDGQVKDQKSKLYSRFKGRVKVGGRSIRMPYVLLTNRHFAQKKFEYAIEAWEKLGDPSVSLVITGRMTKYTEKLREFYLNKTQLHFVGLLSEKDLEMCYKNAAVYVYPAPEEDFGMGMVEAMAAGVPVVAWGNAGPTGIITHKEDGYLARPFDVQDFADGMQRFLEDERFYMRVVKAGKKKVEKHFSYDGHARVLDKHIRKYLFHRL